MQTVAITGKDTLKINDRLIADLADGDVGALTFPNDLVNVKAGKNENILYALNASGKQGELTIRVVRAGPDDKFLNNLLSLMLNNFPGFTLLAGEFLKKVGDGKSNVAKDTYVLAGGVVSKIPEASSNAEGNTDQGLAIYHFKFGQCIRMIQ